MLLQIGASKVPLGADLQVLRSRFSQKHFISESRQSIHARGSVSTGKIVQSLISVKNADSKQLNQFQELSEPPILQHFNKSKTVYFIHIPKTGGSALHKILPMVLQRSGTKMKSTGGRHSVWSVLEGSFLNPRQPFGDVENLQVITQLRNPIDRSISQFYQQPFVNKMARKAGTKVAKQLSTLTFNEYLNNSSLMLKTSTLFRDGSSCVYWLAGLHPDFSWCKSSLKSAVEENRLNTQKTQVPPLSTLLGFKSPVLRIEPSKRTLLHFPNFLEYSIE